MLEGLTPAAHAEAGMSAPDRVLIADLNEDGRDEVLVNVMPAELGRSAGLLNCYEQHGKPCRTHRFGRPMTFGDRHFEPIHRAQHLRKVRDSRARPWRLAVANHAIWYLSQAA